MIGTCTLNLHVEQPILCLKLQFLGIQLINDVVYLDQHNNYKFAAPLPLLTEPLFDFTEVATDFTALFDTLNNG